MMTKNAPQEVSRTFLVCKTNMNHRISARVRKIMHLQKVKKEKKVLYDGISIKRNEIAAKHNNAL